MLRGHSGPVPNVTFSNDGMHVATCSEDRTMKLWDANSGSESTLLGEFDSWVTSVAISSDGSRIAAGAVDNTIRVWDSNSGALFIERADLWIACGASASAQMAAGSLVGSAIGPNHINQPRLRFWMRQRAAIPRASRGHNGLVWSVTFSPDGQRIATAGGELSARFH